MALLLRLCQLGRKKLSRTQLRYKHFRSRKCIWKCLLQNFGILSHPRGSGMFSRFWHRSDNIVAISTARALNISPIRGQGRSGAFKNPIYTITNSKFTDGFIKKTLIYSFISKLCWLDIYVCVCLPANVFIYIYIYTLERQATWCLKSPAIRLYIQANNNRSIKGMHFWPLWGESVGDR